MCSKEIIGPESQKDDVYLSSSRKLGDQSVGIIFFSILNSTGLYL